MFADRARAYGTAFAFCNMVGGQDELVFDGQSMVFDDNGELLARASQYEEELLVCDLGDREACSTEPELADLAEVYGALLLGLRDYVEKNGFRHVGVALSGGHRLRTGRPDRRRRDRARRVTCVVMPSPHSSDETQADARDMRQPGVELIEITIESMMGSTGRRWTRSRPAPRGRPRRSPRPARPSEPDLAAENLQARIRGNLMMALSNQPRLAGPHHRQQERDVGRLRDALRRHGRRLRGDQGRAEDPRLRAGPPAQRARRARAGPGLGHRAAALGRAAPRPARHRLAAALRAARPHARGLRRARPLAARRWSPRAAGARSSTR